MLKFGVKVGVAAGACYYLAEEGVWKESSESVKLYEKISEAVKPYAKEIPVEIPDLPNSERVSYLMKHYWNSGVLHTFNFIEKLPDHVSELTDKGVQGISNNPEMKKFMDSFRAPTQDEKLKEKS